MKIFDTVDSTNLHAMRMISEGMSAHGDVYLARHQSAGRGQRNKIWRDAEHQSLLMTIVLHDGLDKLSITTLNKLVALSVLEEIKRSTGLGNVSIKWPNDIYIGAKKVSGILIENGFKGSQWSYSVIGIGVNVLQAEFPDELDRAVSLLSASGRRLDIVTMGERISGKILQSVQEATPSMAGRITGLFHDKLFKINEWVDIESLSDSKIRKLYFQGVDGDGRAVFVNENNEKRVFNHGEIAWHV